MHTLRLGDGNRVDTPLSRLMGRPKTRRIVSEAQIWLWLKEMCPERPLGKWKQKPKLNPAS